MKRQSVINEYFTGPHTIQSTPKACLYSDTLFEGDCITLMVFSVTEICAKICMSLGCHTPDEELRNIFYSCKTLYQNITKVTQHIEQNMHHKYEKYGGRRIADIIDVATLRQSLETFGESMKITILPKTWPFKYMEDLRNYVADIIYTAKYDVQFAPIEGSTTFTIEYSTLNYKVVTTSWKVAFKVEIWYKILLTKHPIAKTLADLEHVDNLEKPIDKSHMDTFINMFNKVGRILSQSVYIMERMRIFRMSLEIHQDF